MLTSNVVIWRPLLNFLVPFRLPPSPQLKQAAAGTSRSRAILPTFSRLCFNHCVCTIRAVFFWWNIAYVKKFVLDWSCHNFIFLRMSILSIPSMLFNSFLVFNSHAIFTGLLLHSYFCNLDYMGVVFVSNVDFQRLLIQFFGFYCSTFPAKFFTSQR